MFKWFSSRLGANLLFLLFPPLGVIVLWKSSSIAKWWKIIASIITILLVIFIAGPYDEAGYKEPTCDLSIYDKLNLNKKVLLHNNCSLHYWVKQNGNKEWIIFLHGAGADHRMFLEQAKALGKHYNLILVDGRGQGKSKMNYLENEVVFKDMIRDFIAVLNTEAIDSGHIVAQSLGASLAQEIAFYYPKRVKKMALIGCYNQHGKTNLLWQVRNVFTAAALNVVSWKKDKPKVRPNDK